MAFNGSGVFNRLYSWVADAAAAIKISSTRMDAEMDGMATGLSNCVTKDGQTTITANLPMSTFRHTGVGDSSALDSYPSTKQIQNGTITYDATDTGVANAYVAGLSPAPTAYVDGMDVYLKIANTNTGASTINLNALGVKNIKTPAGADPGAGAIIAGQIAHFKYNGTNFLLLTEANIVHTTGVETIAGNKTFSGTLSMTAKAINEAKGAAVASAGTTDIWTPADGNTIHMTGTATITSLGTAPQAGSIRHVIADGAFTLTNNANIICTSAANIICAVNDSFDVYADTTTTMYVLNYTRANGSPLTVSASVITGTIATSQIAASAISQSKLKTTSGQVSIGAPNSANFVLPGGEYGFYPTLRVGGSGGDMEARIVKQFTSGTTFESRIWLSAIIGPGNAEAEQRYIQASPPYNLGDGDIPLFIFLLLNSSGEIMASYIAPEAPWHNNGPTNIRADRYTADGRSFKKMSRFYAEHGSIKSALSKGIKLPQCISEIEMGGFEEIEVTQAIKNADMSIIPHPFLSLSAGDSVIILNPVGDLMESLLVIHESGESISDIINDGYIKLGSEIKNLRSPVGVTPINFSWKLS